MLLVVKFQVTLPILAGLRAREIMLKPILLTVIDPNIRETDLPVSIHSTGDQLVPDYRVHAAMTWRF